MTGFVHVAKQTITEIVLFDARGNAHIAKRELGHEGMVSLVDPAAVEIVADQFDDFRTKSQLLSFGVMF